MSVAVAIDDDYEPPEVLPPDAAVFDALTEEECYLYALMTDPSGLDQAEFTWTNEEAEDGCWRAWEFQWEWWRCMDRRQADQCGRAIGKSESLKARACAFPFVHPGEEMVITAPEGIHADAITDRIEDQLTSTWVLSEMLVGGRLGIGHRPFKAKFKNGSRILGRIPQRTGIGVKGCFVRGSLVLTRRGHVPIEDVVVGDEVLTHKNRWRPVTAVHTFTDDVVWLRVQGHTGMWVTPSQPFWAKEGNRANKGFWSHGADWVRAEDLLEFNGAGSRRQRAYVASPVRFPPAERPPFDTRRAETEPTPGPGFMWLAGLYAAEGSVARTGNAISPNQVTFGIHRDEVEKFRPVLEDLGFKVFTKYKRENAGAELLINSGPLARWLALHVGRGSKNKQVPSWLLGRPAPERADFLAGLLAGDGYVASEHTQELTTTSWAMTVGVKLLAQSLGHSVGLSRNDSPTTLGTGGWWKVSICTHGGVVFQDGHAFSVVARAEAETRQAQEVWDLTVAEDHSYVVEGLVAHNTHPIWLELDEGQDYPDRGWAEVRETLKRELEGAVWRVHGVSRGIPDEFQRITQPGSGWTVHRFTQLHKPTWNADEMAERIEEYGSKEDPDFRRNVMGEHGDAQNAIFILARLMRGVSTDPASAYNASEYHRQVVKFEQVEDRARRQGLPPEQYGMVLADMLDFPAAHHDAPYSVYWMGMDVGIAKDPSAIMVFVEYEPSGEERRRDTKNGISVPPPGISRFKLLTRLELLRIPVPDQAEALVSAVQFYRPRACALDKTGNGLGVLQALQKQARISRLMRIDPDADVLKGAPADVVQANETLTAIKGYDFNGRIVVEIDEERAAELPPGSSIEDIADKAGIKAIAKEYATDKMRELSDTNRLLLPLDENLIRQLTGQTFVYNQSNTDAYGNPTRRFSEGQFHAFDGCRMAVLGMWQEPIEMFLRTAPKKRPVRDVFLGGM